MLSKHSFMYVLFFIQRVLRSKLQDLGSVKSYFVGGDIHVPKGSSNTCFVSNGISKDTISFFLLNLLLYIIFLFINCASVSSRRKTSPSESLYCCYSALCSYPRSDPACLLAGLLLIVMLLLLLLLLLLLFSLLLLLRLVSLLLLLSLILLDACEQTSPVTHAIPSNDYALAQFNLGVHVYHQLCRISAERLHGLWDF